MEDFESLVVDKVQCNGDGWVSVCFCEKETYEGDVRMEVDILYNKTLRQNCRQRDSVNHSG